MSVLEIRDVTRRFLSVTALNRISLSLREGEILAVCGENGAGKSTLMKIISGSDAHGNFEGQMFMDGKEVRFLNTRDAEKMGIEMVYQEISLHLELTVAENLFLGNLPVKKNGCVDWKLLNSRAEECLEAVGLAVSPEQKVKTLSTSKQQLLSIARALAKKPRVLVLDEPTSALTQTEVEHLFVILKKLRKEGISCLYISHKLKEIFELADRIMVMRDGAHIATYDTGMCSDDQLIQDMVGRKVEVLYPKECYVEEQEVLRVEDLTAAHPYIRNKNMLEHVSFTLKKGEILGLAGLVGAGRSELFDALFKAETKGVTGEVYLNGRRIDRYSLVRTKGVGIGYVTEDRKRNGIIGGGSIQMNTTLASLGKICSHGLIRHGRERQAAQKYMKLLEVKAPGPETRLINLSGGNQQKVILAKWMMTDLKVLLLDEPTRGIDVGTKAEIYKLMNEMAKQGVSIIMASSEMPELIAMSDRVLVLGEGRMCGEFTREEVTQEKIMRAIAGMTQRQA